MRRGKYPGWTIERRRSRKENVRGIASYIRPGMDVSVIIPVYNAGPFLASTVRSALDQPEVREVVLVEDGSPDDSLAVCERLVASDLRVKLFRHDGGVNKGAGASRNLGIRQAMGTHIAFLDADDRYLSDRFRAERHIFTEHPDADGVHGAVGWFAYDDEGLERFRQQFSRPITAMRVAVPPEKLFDTFMGFAGALDIGHIHLDALTVKRSSLLRMSRLFREELRLHQDSELILRMAHALRIYAGSIEIPVAERGVHAGNRISRNAQPEHTRLQLQSALLEWAETDGLDKRIVRKFGEDAAFGAMAAARTMRERLRAWGLACRFPGTLKRQDSGEALVATVLGTRSWLARAARGCAGRTYRLLWRLKGGQPPPKPRSMADEHVGTDAPTSA